MRAATVVQQLCKSCRTCFKFSCMFYFTCDRSLRVQPHRFSCSIHRTFRQQQVNKSLQTRLANLMTNIISTIKCVSIDPFACHSNNSRNNYVNQRSCLLNRQGFNTDITYDGLNKLFSTQIIPFIISQSQL